MTSPKQLENSDLLDVGCSDFPKSHRETAESTPTCEKEDNLSSLNPSASGDFADSRRGLKKAKPAKHKTKAGDSSFPNGGNKTKKNMLRNGNAEEAFISEVTEGVEETDEGQADENNREV